MVDERADGRDVEGAKRFYGDLFGWQTETFGLGDAEGMLWRLEATSAASPAAGSPRRRRAMLPAGDDGPPRWSVDFWVEDVEARSPPPPGSAAP